MVESRCAAVFLLANWHSDLSILAGLIDRKVPDTVPDSVAFLEKEWVVLSKLVESHQRREQQVTNVLQLCIDDDSDQLRAYVKKDTDRFFATQYRFDAKGNQNRHSGKSMLMLVAESGATKCVIALLDFGAAKDFTTKRGESASILARANGFGTLADALDEGLDAVRGLDVDLSPRIPPPLDDTVTLPVGGAGSSSSSTLHVFKTKVLGIGNASVYSGELSDRPGEQLAVKIIFHGKPAASIGLDGQSKEAMLQSRLGSHPNLVKYFCHEEHLGDTYLVMERCDCSLVEAVTGQRLSDQELISTGRQICGAIQHLHEECNIAHRDLKPANILLLGATVKVCDFGGAKDLGLDRSKTMSGADQGGSEHWQPPERRDAESQLQQLREELAGLTTLKKLKTRAVADGVPKEALDLIDDVADPIDRAKKLIVDNAVKLWWVRVDAFSLGCVLFFVLTRGRHPFGEDHLEKLNNIADSRFNLEALSPMPPAQQLVGMLLAKEAKMRPTAADSALHEPFSVQADHEEENLDEPKVETTTDTRKSMRCPVGETGFHIYLSSRSKDAELASQVLAQLKERGYKVFVANPDDEACIIHLKATPVMVTLSTGTVGSHGRPDFLQIQNAGDWGRHWGRHCTWKSY